MDKAADQLVTPGRAAGERDPARPLVIVNPAAQRGRTGRELARLLAPLREALGELDVAPTERPDHGRELAAAAVREGRALVISLGGDGTLNEVVNGLMDAAAGRPAALLPRLGVVATGTGGDFGRSLSVPHHLEAYVAAIASGREQPLDVGVVRFTGPGGAALTRHWINVVSGGIGGLVDLYKAAAPRWMNGRLAYGQAALRGIVTCPRVTLRCRAVLPDGSAHERLMHTHAVAVCNGHTFGGGMLIGPQARPDDGLLQVVSFETSTKLLLVRRFLTVYRGTHLQEEGVHSLICRSVELTPVDDRDDHRRGNRGAAGGRGWGAGRHGLFPLDVDGDARGDVPLAAELLPGALLVRA
jgi:diacylglycerol kinase (ATP)